MRSLNRIRRMCPRSWISVLGVLVVIGGAVAIGALLMAPLEALHAKPKPAIEYTASDTPAQAARPSLNS